MPKPQLPALTHLQFLVLGILRAEEQRGRTLRDALAGYGIRRTGPAFYQLMARLEKDRLVDGWYEQITVGDQAVTERRYRITADGKKRWNDARAFYEHVARVATTLRWSDA
jgi:DNA-binding PadR family transcriptional regulator